MSPFSFLILLICMFSLCRLINLHRGLSILLIFSKNQLFVSLILWFVFCVLFCWFQPSVWLFPGLYSSWVSLLLFFLELSGVLLSIMWAFSLFFMWALSAMYFPLSTAFIVSHRFGYVMSLFLLNSRKTLIFFFISYLTRGWYSSWVFSFHEFVGFLGLELLLNSNFIPSWSDSTKVVTTFFCICGCLLPIMGWILEKVPWDAEKKVYFFSVSVECSIDVC